MKKAWYTAKLLAGQYGIELVAMATRFDETEYFVEDRNTPDEYGLPSVIYQSPDRKKAIHFFLNKLEELEASLPEESTHF